MNYGDLLSTAARLLRHNRNLWLLGVLGTLGWYLLGLTADFFISTDPAVWMEIDPEQLLVRLEQVVTEQMTALIAGLLAATAVLGVIWSIALIAEGGLITAVHHRDQHDAGFGRRLQDGLNLFKPLLAIDALVFLPPAVMVIGGQIILSGGFVWTMWRAQSGGPPPSFTPLILLMSCAGLLFCLAIPAMLVAAYWRLLAFRQAALVGDGIRADTRAIQPLLKQNGAEVFITAVITAAVSVFTGTIVSGLEMAAQLPGDLLGMSALSTAGQLIIAPIALIINGGLFAYVSAVWTLAYEQWTADDTPIPAPDETPA